MLPCCVDDQEAKGIMEEVLEGTFGTHTNGHDLAHKILRAGYYWTKMESAYYIIGPTEPNASNGHRFILVAIDYFTKWVEAASYSNVTKSVMVKFIKRDIICRYDLLAHIITNNGTNLNNRMMTRPWEQFNIKHHNSTLYRPKMNGAVKAANKNIKKIVQKMVVTYKDWHDMLPYALHGYHTSMQTSTGATPYSLVYGTEAVLLVEVEIPSLRILVEVELEDAEWIQS
ncbi:Pol polyprotein, partial [Mucuna pruriens]